MDLDSRSDCEEIHSQRHRQCHGLWLWSLTGCPSLNEHNNGVRCRRESNSSLCLDASGSTTRLAAVCCSSRPASVADAAAATNETTQFADQMNVVNHGIKTSRVGLTRLALEKHKTVYFTKRLEDDLHR